MSFINDDFVTEIIKTGTRERLNKKSKGIAFEIFSTNSEDYEYTQLLNVMKNEKIRRRRNKSKNILVKNESASIVTRDEVNCNVAVAEELEELPNLSEFEDELSEFDTGMAAANWLFSCSRMHFASPTDATAKERQSLLAVENNAGCPVGNGVSKRNRDPYDDSYGETLAHNERRVVSSSYTGEKPYECKVCGKGFRYKGHLVGHFRTHTGDKPYTCDVCCRGFGYKNNLDNHYRTHTGDKPHKCDVCGQGFTKKYKLAVHYGTHAGGGEVPPPHHRAPSCDVCGKRFAEKSDLDAHRRAHAGEKPYACDVCGKAFGHKRNLVDHYKTHAAANPCLCDVCGKGFKYRSNLVVHYRTHTGDKPYVCDVCEKRFAQKNDLVLHYRSHTGEKPYVCDVCVKGFAQKSDLAVHYKTHAGGKKPQLVLHCNTQARTKKT